MTQRPRVHITQASSGFFLEEICCDLCRYQHVKLDGFAPDQIEIVRDVRLPGDGCFADIRVQPPDEAAPYFVEIKWGYAGDEFIERLTRKYGASRAAGVDGLLLANATGDPAMRRGARQIRCRRGDGIFGFPETTPTDIEDALRCARRLVAAAPKQLPRLKCRRRCASRPCRPGA